MDLRIRWFCQKLILPGTMLVLAAEINAQALEPRLYSNTPVGLNFLLGGYVYSEGNANVDPSVKLENGEVTLHTPFVAYARSFGLWGKSAKFNVLANYGLASGSATFNGVFKEREVDGFADPQFRISINLMGAPALSLAEFKSYKQDFILGASLKFTAPLGQYDSDRLLNIGTNRWSFTPELGLSKTVGPVILELSGAVTYFTDNSDFLGHKKKQSPIYALQTHLVYTFKNGVWTALDGTYYWGGRSTIGDVGQKDRQRNSRIGATLALPVTRYHSAKLYASTGFSTQRGTNFDTYGVAWQYRWGE